MRMVYVIDMLNAASLSVRSRVMPSVDVRIHSIRLRGA